MKISSNPTFCTAVPFKKPQHNLDYFA